jgi:ribosomal-protein-alanine N-acetyltransferase
MNVSTRVAIRALRPDDVAAVTKILAEAPEAAAWSAKGIAEAVAWGGGLGLVGESEGEVTGVLMGRWTGNEAEILNIAVTPERRRRGEGGALLKAALDEFRSRGATRVFLEVRESNQAATAFYTKHGFSKMGHRPAYYREPEEAAVLMEKILTA